MNRKNIKNVFLAITMLLVSSPVLSQDSQHEISVYAGGGLSTLTNKTTSAVSDKKGVFGGTFGVGYTYYITPEFGLQTGLEYSMYSSKLKVSELSGKYRTTDSDGISEDFDFGYKLNGYSETQKAGYLQIPIMGQYLKSIGEETSFYVSAGVKIGFALNKSSDSKLATLTTQGFYPDTDVTIAEDGADIGFGTYTSLKSDSDLELKTAFLAALETGVKWNIGETTSLYTGVYFDYCLNNVNKKGNKHLAQYNKIDPSKPILNSASQSLSSDQSLVSKINPMAVGIKVRFAFGL